MEIDMEQLEIDCDRELTIRENLRMVWWSFFYKKKLDEFMRLVKCGYKVHDAYIKAKNYKPLKKNIICLGPNLSNPPRCNKQCKSCKEFQVTLENPKIDQYTPEQLKKMKENFNKIIENAQ